MNKIQNGNPEGKKLVAFTSAHSHYTIKRSTWIMGMGLDAAINVAVDSNGKMSPQALGKLQHSPTIRIQQWIPVLAINFITRKIDEAIIKAKAEGYTPFCVNATAGSTVLGVFDDLVCYHCHMLGFYFCMQTKEGNSKYLNLVAGVRTRRKQIELLLFLNETTLIFSFFGFSEWDC